ncbi:MAG: SirB2 family protein [Cocleimonas sp.]|nr:SirB2 family protein [Cocleimonas sp.]
MKYLVHNIHFVLALVSLLLYLVRGSFLLLNKPSQTMMSLAALTSLALFGTGLALVYSSTSMSFANYWVVTKIVTTLLYVFFGVMAFRSELPKQNAIVLWLFGLIAFAYTFAIAKGLLSPLT